MTSAIEGWAKSIETKTVYAVNLAVRECACKVFQQHKILCAHACVVIRKLGGLAHDFCDAAYETRCFRETYAYRLPLLQVDEFPLDAECGEPTTIRARGRPKGKRELSTGEPGVGRGKNKACTRCRNRGHSAALCPLRAEDADAEESDIHTQADGGEGSQMVLVSESWNVIDIGKINFNEPLLGDDEALLDSDDEDEPFPDGGPTGPPPVVVDD